MFVFEYDVSNWLICYICACFELS